MNRLLATIRTDFRLQFRNGFYYASAFVAVVTVIFLSQINIQNWAYIWPMFILGNLTINTYYFMSGQVLLEKGEGTMEAQVVTPLRPREYLGAKVFTLGVLSTIETLIVIILISGLGFNWPLLLLGLAVLVALYALYGFILVARYDSLSEFLFPSVLWTMVLTIPIIYYLGFSDSWLFFLHPIQAPMLLLQSAFTSIPAWQIAYGLVYGGLWVVIAFVFSQRVYKRFVVRKEGTG